MWVGNTLNKARQLIIHVDTKHGERKITNSKNGIKRAESGTRIKKIMAK